MAELHVQRKRGNYLWSWLLLVILLIAGAVYFYINYGQKKNQVTTTKPTSALVKGLSHTPKFEL